MNHCGNCKACCKVLRIEELAKPPYKWCQHICSAGCSIYPDRPTACRTFVCEWLRSQDEPIKMPPELRPDRCGVVLRQNEGSVQAYVSEGTDWREGPMFRFLSAISQTRLVAFVQRAKVHIMDKGVIKGSKVVPELMTATGMDAIRVDIDDIPADAVAQLKERFAR